MQLLLFLLKTKFINLRKNYRHASTLIMHLLLFFSAIGNAWLCAAGLNYLQQLQKTAIIKNLLTICNFVYLLLPIILLFVPSFGAKVRFFQKTDPVGYAKRTITEMVYNIVSPLFLLLLLTIAIMFALSDSVSPLQALSWLAITVLSFNIRLIIQDLVMQHPDRKILLTILLLGIFYSWYAFSAIFPVYLVTLATVIVSAVLLYCLQYMAPTTVVKKTSTTGNNKRNIYSLLSVIYFGTSTIRVNLIIAAVFKVVTLIIISAKSLPKSVPTLKIFVLLLSSSLIFFTYIHNNIWGYIKNTYELIASSNRRSLLLKTYIMLASFPITADMLVTITAITASGRNLLPGLLPLVIFYILTLLANITIGFTASANDAAEIKQSVDFTSFKSNTSLPYSFLSTVTCCLISFLFVNVKLVYFAPALFVLLLFCLYKTASGKKKTPIFSKD